MTLLVTIIIPTYNRAEHVRDAVVSGFSQTHRPIEVIVVDDGSTDHTLEVLHSLQTTYGEALRIISQPNAGASAARNAGIEAARGEYIQFLDSDDLLDEEKITLQVEALSSAPDADVAACFGRMIDAEGESSLGRNLGTDPDHYVEALCGRVVHILPTLSPLWRRAFLSDRFRWDPEISLGDDLDFHVRCLIEVKKITFVPLDLFVVQSSALERLSDYSTQNYKLWSLLKTRERVFFAISEQGQWSRKCADNNAEALRTLYFNFLSRGAPTDVQGFEKVALRMVRISRHGMVLVALISAKRLLGRRRFLSIANRALSSRRLKASGAVGR